MIALKKGGNDDDDYCCCCHHATDNCNLCDRDGGRGNEAEPVHRAAPAMGEKIKSLNQQRDELKP